LPAGRSTLVGHAGSESPGSGSACGISGDKVPLAINS
jgi:hypothetical protein